MDDFTILHLSDLHINKTDGNLPPLMDRLLNDIKEQSEYCENIIIVVTGDLVHHGNYAYKNSVLKFFDRLHKILSVKVKDIFIIPGNHDKERSILDKDILKKYRSEKNKNKKFYDNYWKYIELEFQKHIDLTKKIYKIFEPDKKYELYGAEAVEINNKRIAFLRCNTAWSCMGDKDERHLKFGRFQLNKLIQDYEQHRGKGYDLTIVLAHHPLNWLSGKEETMVKREYISNDKLNVDLYIGGHIHDSEITNLQNTRHTLTTLVAGIGWPDDENESNYQYEHNYAWYTCNMDINSMDVYVRKADRMGKFEPDINFYPDAKAKLDQKIIMPIKASNTKAFFDLTTIQKRSPKACYITDDMIQWMQLYMMLMGNVRRKVYIELEKERRGVLEQINLQFSQEEIYKKIIIDGENVPDKEKLFKGKEDILEKMFQAYLYKICYIFSEEAVKLLNKNEITEAELRVHFRWLNKKKKIETATYDQLCLAKAPKWEEYIMKPLAWDELLKFAYEKKHPLIASVNHMGCGKSYCKNENRKDKNNTWCDFLTAVPEIEGNDYIECVPRNKEVICQMPWITFGVTVYREEDRKLLFLMDYFRIDQIVSEFIREFRYFMPINMQHFVENNIADTSTW